ncbi:MAG: hypothetical protein OEY97_09715 [Nitrospirota bacterium]|nr:hypothetical protein [Nitrospirota bacterium]
MKRLVMWMGALALLAPSVAMASGPAFAPEPAPAPPFTLPAAPLSPSAAWLQLAADMDATPAVTPLAAVTAEAVETPFRTRLFTANKLHMVLGLGSVAAGVMAATSAPDSEGGGPVDDSDHQAYAELATGLGLAAVATGLVFHWEDFSFRDGLLDPDILHMLLGTLGAGGFLYAINTAPASTHTTAGPVGLVAMALAIKIAW